MIKVLSKVSGCAALVVLTQLAHAACPIGNEWFCDAQRGWYWHEVPAEPSPERDAAQPAPSKPLPDPRTMAGLKAALAKAKEDWLEHPTAESSARLQGLMMVLVERGQRAGEAMREAQQIHPYLTAAWQRPQNTVGANAMDDAAKANTHRVVENLSRSAGIFFFFRSDCGYCHAQVSALNAFLLRHRSFALVPISLDGGTLPGLRRKPELDRSGLAAQLGVDTTPTLMVFRNGEFQPLAQGVVDSAEQLEQALIASAARAGWIDRATYESTRAVRPNSSLSTAFLDTLTPEDAADGNRLAARIREYFAETSQ